MPMIRKEVTLDLETWELAQKMENFSQWVRIGLRESHLGTDLASEARLRIRWAKAAHLLASLALEYALQVDPNCEKTVNDLITKALNQTTLEEF